MNMECFGYSLTGPSRGHMSIRIPMRSPDIIDAFIKSGQQSVKINVDVVGRGYHTVYSSLLMYTKKYPELGISVKIRNGEIYLVKNENQSDSGIFD